MFATACCSMSMDQTHRRWSPFVTNATAFCYEQLGLLRVATVSKDLPASWQAHQTDHPENPFEGPEIYEGQGEVGATSFVRSPPQPHSPAAPQTQASSQTPGQLGVARVDPVRDDDDEMVFFITHLRKRKVSQAITR